MFCVLNHQCLTSFDTTCLSMVWRHTHTVRIRKCGHDRDAVEITTISGGCVPYDLLLKIMSTTSMSKAHGHLSIWAEYDVCSWCSGHPFAERPWWARCWGPNSILQYVLRNNIKMWFFSREIIACKIAALTVAPEIQHHPQKNRSRRWLDD